MTCVAGSKPAARAARTPPACASASTMSTPGMTGWPGKCPWKKGSFIVTFFSATTLSSVASSTRSTRKNGYRCGRIPSISRTSKELLPLDRRARRRRRLALAGVEALVDLVGDVEAPVGPEHRALVLLDDHRVAVALRDGLDDG